MENKKHRQLESEQPWEGEPANDNLELNAANEDIGQSVREILDYRHKFEYSHNFDGVQIHDVPAALARLEEVLIKLNIDPNKVRIVRLPGKQYGESTAAEEIYLDPRALEFTIGVLGLLAAHEEGHQGDKIPNEAAVHLAAEAKAKRLFGEANVTLTPEYQDYLRDFERYLAVFPAQGNREQTLNHILQSYLYRDFDSLYDPFMAANDDQEEAQEIFDKAFPNLRLVA